MTYGFLVKFIGSGVGKRITMVKPMSTLGTVRVERILMVSKVGSARCARPSAILVAR